MSALRPGLPASFLLHAGLLAGGLIVLPQVMPPPSPPMPVLPVELVTADTMTSITAARPDAEEEQPLEVAAEAQPEPEPSPAPVPEPERKITEAVAAQAPVEKHARRAAAPDATPKAAPTPPKAAAPAPKKAAEKRPEPAPKVPPKAQASAATKAAEKAPEKTTAANQKASSGLDLDQLSALTDRSVDRAARRTPEMAAREGAFAKAERSRAAAGLASTLTGTLEDSLRSQISKCWRVPPNLARAQDLIVEIRIQLAPDGSVKGTPAVVRPSNLTAVDPGLRAAAEAGLRAIRSCSPYTLPAERYEVWQDVIWKFDPTEMARS